MPSSTITPTKVADYAILPLSIPSRTSYPISSAKHYLYIRPHTPRIPTADAVQSLFIANVPIDATEDAVRDLFANQLGGARINAVRFDGWVHGDDKNKGKNLEGGAVDEALVAGADGEYQLQKRNKKRKRGAHRGDEEDGGSGLVGGEAGRLPVVWERDVLKSGSAAVVVFVDEASRDGAMREVRRKIKGGKSVEWSVGDVFGEKRYRTHHALTYPSTALLTMSTSAYLEGFAKSEKERARLLARQRTGPDEDGFITVTRGSRTGPARLEDAEAAAERLAERDKKRSKEDFYRFQLREKRKEKEGELRRAFEEDKRKVEEMRRARGKPKVRTAAAAL